MQLFYTMPPEVREFCAKILTVSFEKMRVVPQIVPNHPLGGFFIANKNAANRCGTRRADGGARTRTPVKAGDFKSPVSAIPPHPQSMKSIPFLEMIVKMPRKGSD